MAKSVTLRQRKMSSGNVQLYLDINLDGKRRTEGLGLTLKPGKDRVTKLQNEQTMSMAQAIAEKRKQEIILRSNGIEVKRTGSEFFFDYYKECADKRNGCTRDDWYSALNHISAFEPNDKITFAYIDRDWAERLRHYLLNDATTFIRHRDGRPNKLSRNSASAVYSKFISCIHDAIADGIIDKDPTLNVKIIPIEEGTREYLTEEELVKLMETPCSKDNVKRAFLFCCMTGLRFSDVSSLTWGQVRTENDRTRVVFRMHKTRGNMYQDINKTAESMLGERKGPNEKVFSLPNNASANSSLCEWTANAGITKKITFHCSRHTCATLLLTKGADIYTTSKILGHTKVQTTQIYGKIIDKKRQDATDLLDNIL